MTTGPRCGPLAVALLPALLAPAARAYTLYRTDGGAPLFWPGAHTGGESPIHVTLRSEPPEELSGEAAFVAMVHAFRTWSPLVCGGVVTDLDLRFDRADAGDELGNQVRFVSRRDEWIEHDSVVAITHLTVDLDTAEILEADIEINDAHHAFSLFPSLGERDLVSVLIHESGHFFGIDHSDHGGALMRAAGADPAAPRQLQPDDVRAFCAIYGTAGPGRRVEDPSCGAGPGPGAPFGPLVGGLLFLILWRHRSRSPAGLLVLLVACSAAPGADEPRRTGVFGSAGTPDAARVEDARADAGTLAGPDARPPRSDAEVCDCPPGQHCIDDRCLPCACLRAECGSDPCGAPCGTCAAGLLCNDRQHCVAPTGSCSGRCLEAGDGVRCGCDAACPERGDCCPDACQHCDLPSCGCFCEDTACGADSGCGFPCVGPCPVGALCFPALGCCTPDGCSLPGG